MLGGKVSLLPHLHPFRFKYQLPAFHDKPEEEVMIQVGFGLQCFTRKCKPDGPESEFYRDDREARTFDYGRYKLSKHLKQIAQSLDRRRASLEGKIIP